MSWPEVRFHSFKLRPIFGDVIRNFLNWYNNNSPTETHLSSLLTVLGAQHPVKEGSLIPNEPETKETPVLNRTPTIKSAHAHFLVVRLLDNGLHASFRVN
jgi:hypothetical protein